MPAAPVRMLCVVIAVAAVVCPVAATTLDTGDGLSVTFSDLDGSVTAVSVNGIPVPLVPGEPGGLSMRIGEPIAPYVLQHLDFDAGTGPIVSARNASWDNYGSYVTWLPDGGPDNSGHLLLGDGSAEGAGMAMDAAIPVAPGSKVRIAWQALAASTETTHILCVRIYDALGQDITSSSNTPTGWSYTGTSLAHGVWGFGCAETDTWEQFERFYPVSTDAAFARVSLRHWTGGDHLLHIDDFNLDVVGGAEWGDRVPISGPIVPAAGGFTQSVDVPGRSLHVDTAVTATGGHLEIDLALQDTSAPLADRALQVCWTLPVQADAQQWWDDIDSARLIAPGILYRNTFDHNRHPVSFYPFSSITSADYGLSLCVPQDRPAAQRFEYDTAVGLSSAWEICLSPVTTKLGPGHADLTLSVLHHDPTWGFRAAVDRYYELHPDYFTKRTTLEGAWMYPIHPSLIPDPLDFGFAFLETHPFAQAERDLCDQLGIGVFYYTEPWCPWQPWGEVDEKPPYEERVARLEDWATAPGGVVTWLPDGGVDNTGHLLLGDGLSTGAGMATAEPFAVAGGDAVRIAWQARTLSIETTQIASVRIFDSAGYDITEATPAPDGWFWSSGSAAHVVPGIVNTTPDTWEPFSYVYELPASAVAMRVSIRHWTGGDHFVHIDDLLVESTYDAVTYLSLPFDVDDQNWASAQNTNWDDGGPIWLRFPRQQTAQAVVNSSPLDAEGRYFIDSSSYLWHEWGGVTASMFQAWPVNPDPDLPTPSTFELHASDEWLYRELDQNAGVYIDSVTTNSISSWENRRAEHLAVSDSPLTFSWDDGEAAQIAPQAQAELLEAVAAEVHSRGKLMMLNIFPSAMRFHSHRGDVLGSEVWQLVESDTDSRMRRTLARQRIVSNLLQWGWDLPEYITYDQMEQFIRGQLFWGFYPAVSSAGGAVVGGAPDRYFLHPELYERDRPLFQFYIPIIRDLSTAGWEPITHATGGPSAEVERFGDFARGDVLLTVRGADQAGLEDVITIDLVGMGQVTACAPLGVWDVVSDVALPAERLASSGQARFAVSLAAEEVGVYRVTVSVAGDVDLDDDVDTGDFAQFCDCQLGVGVIVPDPDCQNADLDCDDDTDLADFGILQRCYGGTDVPADPNCAS